jgi:sterol desaturase/sphingolipid hydroxylase (fatty acid hydroxylase superfamily)
MHGMHHAFPQYRHIIVINIRRILIYIIAFFLIMKIVVSNRCNFAILTGIMIGLTCYDALHYWMHFGWRTDFQPLLKLQRSHLKHHYKDSSRGFGVSNTFWDHIFGTTHK